jgi:predicted nuclease of predicted toxin-antitoxin system
MRFLADMCVDVRIVKWLQEQGHDATHLRDEGLHRMPNGEIFKKAINEDRVVITFDLVK